jgi:hypothetical protein
VKSVSESNQKAEDRPWLREKVYDPKRKRTVDLVKRAVDSLAGGRWPISLVSISTRSRELDPGGKGVSLAAILHNEEARIYYEQHRNWKGRSRKRPVDKLDAAKVATLSIKVNRDVARARCRYLKMNKTGLVERLLAIEQAYASQEELWLQINDEMLTWRLRAERAEARLPTPPMAEPSTGL